MANYIHNDLSGKWCGDLKVLKRVENGKFNEVRYLCFCKRCGNEKIISSQCLKNGDNITCGCGNPFKKKEYGEASFNRLVRHYKKSAKERNLLFSLDNEYFKKLTKSRCFYCGCEPNQTVKADKENGDYTYNGIDRLDNNVGYIKSNCVPCCNNCNKAKNDITFEEFITWVFRVHTHIHRNDNIPANPEEQNIQVSLPVYEEVQLVPTMELLEVV
jgi:hypothetical protein